MLIVNSNTPVDPVVLAVLDHINDMATELGFQYIMIGAKAMDIQLHNVYGLRTFRPTNDTDFAVALEGWPQFLRLKEALVGTGKFVADKGVQHRLWYEGVSIVDVVPFGGVAEREGRVIWPGEDSRSINVLGFQEISATAETVVVDAKGTKIRVATLPGLTLLKIFAWEDRLLLKDVVDVSVIMRNYHHVIDPDRPAQESHVFRSVGFDLEKAGVVFLGKDAASIVDSEIIERARGIVSGQSGDRNFVVKLASALQDIERGDKLSLAEEYLSLFLSGFSK